MSSKKIANEVDKIQYLPLNDTSDSVKLSEFIKTEIEPYLDISLAQKLTVPNIDEYAIKLAQLADGYIAYQNREICGVIAAYIRNRFEKDKVYLTLLGVKSKIRKCGIGRTLLNKVISDLPNECTIYTNVDKMNENAWIYYQKMGFKSVSIKDGRRTISLARK